tara:strand:+ start:40746 stop:40862 length:117 start_codon:yes stop_codon:yes gene_type:complete
MRNLKPLLFFKADLWAGTTLLEGGLILSGSDGKRNAHL